MSRSFLSQDRMNGYRDGRTPGPIFLKLGYAIRYRRERAHSPCTPFALQEK